MNEELVKSQAKSPTFSMRMDKSGLTTGGLNGWNTKTVKCPIMFKLAVHPRQLVWHWWHGKCWMLHKKEHLKRRDRNYVGWKHLVFQISGNIWSSEVSLPKTSAIKTELHDPSCQVAFLTWQLASFYKSNLINELKHLLRDNIEEWLRAQIQEPTAYIQIPTLPLPIVMNLATDLISLCLSFLFEDWISWLT